MIDVVALALAPLSLVAPFSGVTIVIASWLASSGLVFVKETLDWWDTTSTCIALVGVTVTSIFGSHASPVYSAADLYATSRSPPSRRTSRSRSALAVPWLLGAANVGRCARRRRGSRSCSSRTRRRLRLGEPPPAQGRRLGHPRRAPDRHRRLRLAALRGEPRGARLCALAPRLPHFTLANSPVSYGVPYRTAPVLTIVSAASSLRIDRMPPAHFGVVAVAISLLGVALRVAPPPPRARAGRRRRRPRRRPRPLPIATHRSAATGPTHRAASRPPRSPPPRRRSRASTSGAGCSPPPLAEARRRATRPSSPRHASCVFSVELSFYRSWTAQRWTTQRQHSIQHCDSHGTKKLGRSARDAWASR